MSLHTLTDALEGLNPRAVNTNAAVVTDAQALNRMVGEYSSDTALTTTTALAERSFFKAKRKCRITAISYIANATVTGTGTASFFTLLIAKHPASAYGTPVNVSTYAADTATTDDAAAFTPKEIGWGTTYASATSTVFDMAIGDVLTIEVTKASSGMTFPVSQIVVHADPRD